VKKETQVGQRFLTLRDFNLQDAWSRIRPDALINNKNDSQAISGLKPGGCRPVHHGMGVGGFWVESDFFNRLRKSNWIVSTSHAAIYHLERFLECSSYVNVVIV